MQVDIGYGDAVTPKPHIVEFPTLLDFPAPMIQAYSHETAIAEKLHAMIALGITNSRMKDFFDIEILARNFSFDGNRLRKAIESTFARQGTAIPTNSPPTPLSDEFCADKSKSIMWSAFVKRHRLEDQALSLVATIKSLRKFLLPLLSAIGASIPFNKKWSEGGPWQ